MRKLIVLLFVTTILFGARLETKKMTWTGSPDAVVYRVYCADLSVNLNYLSSYEETTELYLDLLEGICGLTDGVAKYLGVSAVNDYGSESDIIPAGGLVFTPNFQIPVPPANVQIN